MGVSRRATITPAASNAAKRGMAIVTLWPRRRRAFESAAITSARPPTFTIGASSEATKRMSIGGRV